ncbi:hypothetical protein FB451DRAFT_1015433, partial [Mycena latifolia]
EKARSDAIDRDSKRYKKECKILLLGSGESGKSTIVKQIPQAPSFTTYKNVLRLGTAVEFYLIVRCSETLLLSCPSFSTFPWSTAMSAASSSRSTNAGKYWRADRGASARGSRETRA